MPEFDARSCWDGQAANGPQIDAILRHYASPLAGWGEMIATVARREQINPILLLAVMQQATHFAARPGDPQRTLYAANPFAIHFSPQAKGIAKLRLPNGDLPSFSQSLEAAVRQLKRAGGQAGTPLTAIAMMTQPPDMRFAQEVITRYLLLQRRVANM
jgi:hypothetical protein